MILPLNSATHLRSFIIAVCVGLGLSLMLLGLTLLSVLPRLAPGAGPGTGGALASTPQFDFQIMARADVPGWSGADPRQAIGAFVRSCAAHRGKPDTAPANPVAASGPLVRAHIGNALFSGTIGDWRPACRMAAKLSDEISPAVARTFFEDHFVFVRIITRDAPDAPAEQTGLITGYFEPVYSASDTQTGAYQAPLYARPDDLVDIDLGRFRDELAGTRLAGRLSGTRLTPFESRADINDGALSDTTPVLAWLDRDDAFFLHIQGSGVLTFDDGRTVRVGYAGQNGHPYTAIGKPLIERGILTRDTVSLQTIRAWLDGTDPESAKALREENASYVFFRILSNLPDPALGPLGAQGVQLTPHISLAVDRRYHAMGTPIWVSDDGPDRDNDGDNSGPPRQHLMIAQDTGGAIRGPVRGDFFWGRGEAAKRGAGTMRARGTFIALIPKPAVGEWWLTP
ncbi:MAG: murein transglycosylase A [Pseudomonadota bacterium]